MPYNPAYGPYIAVYSVSVLSPPNNGDYLLAADSTAINPPLNLGDTVQFLPYSTLSPRTGRLEEVRAIGASKVLFRVSADTGDFMFLCEEHACVLDLWTRLRRLAVPDKWLGMFDCSNYTPRLPVIKPERCVPPPPNVCYWSLLSSSRDDWAEPMVER